MTHTLFTVTWRASSGRIRRSRPYLAASPQWALRAFRKEVSMDAVVYSVLDLKGNGINLRRIPEAEPAFRLPDLRFDALDIGGPWVLTAMTQDGVDWIDEHFPGDATRLGNAITVKHRDIAGIARDARADGLIVGGAVVS